MGDKGKHCIGCGSKPKSQQRSESTTPTDLDTGYRSEGCNFPGCSFPYLQSLLTAQLLQSPLLCLSTFWSARVSSFISAPGGRLDLQDFESLSWERAGVPTYLRRSLSFLHFVLGGSQWIGISRFWFAVSPGGGNLFRNREPTRIGESSAS